MLAPAVPTALANDIGAPIVRLALALNVIVDPLLEFTVTVVAVAVNKLLVIAVAVTDIVTDAIFEPTVTAVPLPPPVKLNWNCVLLKFAELT